MFNVPKTMNHQPSIIPETPYHQGDWNLSPNKIVSFPNLNTLQILKPLHPSKPTENQQPFQLGYVGGNGRKVRTKELLNFRKIYLSWCQSIFFIIFSICWKAFVCLLVRIVGNKSCFGERLVLVTESHTSKMVIDFGQRIIDFRGELLNYSSGNLKRDLIVFAMWDMLLFLFIEDMVSYDL